MSRRVLILEDDDLLLVLAWAEVAKSASETVELPDDVIAHDWQDDDEALAEKVRGAQLG